MSRLTTSPFHKPSPFSFPRAPLSPPDTNVESQAVPSVLGALPILDTDVPSSTESPSARFRRVSSLAYHTSGLRDRDRISHRNYKSFIVVIPPPSFLQEHGQLGHTLSFGPPHRLSQGLLMPLFPTMYAQLNAIAREFNFPSTSGICLYLQHTDNGITVTPRISDESWQMIWSHVFEATTPSSPGPPICGKVEFDIDRRSARWYPSWIASSHQVDHQRDVSMSLVPSTAPSLAHFREESRVTFEDNDEQVYGPQSAPATRHIPKKLSLVDRLEALSIRSASHASRPAMMTPPDNVPSTTQTLSPIFQEDEPQTAKLNLEKRVESWRAGATLHPTPLAATGQISLEPANLPNSMSFDISSNPEANDELNLEDFAWSISSAGPSDYDPESPLTWDYRVPSVHLANRLEGSVCLTPSVCTSFGPSDYTLSPLSISGDFRSFTPDIAYRMYDDMPPTPTTATSWGPPSVDWSPTQSEYAYSIDLGQRGVFSQPPTPSTATSWGPPSSYPPTPLVESYVPTPDAGHRTFDLDFVQLDARFPSRPWRFVWPYNANKQQFSSPWQFTWPYRNSHRLVETESPYLNSQSRYTHLRNFASIYEYFDDRAPGNLSSSSLSPLLTSIPFLQNVASLYRYFSALSTSSGLHGGTSDVVAVHAVAYPFFVLYPPQYPYFDLYPRLPQVEDDKTCRPPLSVQLDALYPVFNIYPAIYPWNLDEIYPPCRLENNVSVQVDMSTPYPCFDIYPAIYPYVTPYPSVEIAGQATRLTTLRPRASNLIPISVCHPPFYPSFNLYPPVYPEFELYPANEAYATHRPVSVQLDVVYPAFNLYPAVYPYFDIYPTLPAKARLVSNITASSVDVLAKGLCLINVENQYPFFDIYKATYPTFDIYPSLPADILATDQDNTDDAPNLYSATVFYPIFNIYPAVKPRCDVHPAEPVPESNTSMYYPFFNLYPAVYPHFDLYPAGKFAFEQDETIVNAHTQYPYFQLYPAVYPYFDLYPAGKFAFEQDRTIVNVHVQYPYFQLYSAVYPFFDMYPSMQPTALARVRKTHKMLHEEAFSKGSHARKSHRELHVAVFQGGIVSSPSGTYVPPVPPRQTLPARPRSGSVARPINGPRTSRVVTAVPSIAEAETSTIPAHRLSPIKERLTTLNRSNSAVPVRPPPEKPLDRSHSVSVRTKRDSLVLQRVKVFNAATDDTEGQRHIGQSVPKPVRSRYPFA